MDPTILDNAKKAPQRSESLTDTAYRQIRDRILYWELGPNDVLTEAGLANDHKVSRSPIRSALSKLHRDGLVEPISRGGYRVTSISLHDVHEIYDFRVLLEGEAAARAAMSATEDEVNKVLETHRTWGIELENRTKASLRSYVEYHDEIHLQIAGLSGSKRLQEFISRLLFESTRFRMSDPAMSQGVISLGKEREDTRKILLAIARQDADSARRIMVEHIAEAKQRSLEYLLKRGGVASVSSV